MAAGFLTESLSSFLTHLQDIQIIVILDTRANAGNPIVKYKLLIELVWSGLLFHVVFYVERINVLPFPKMDFA